MYVTTGSGSSGKCGGGGNGGREELPRHQGTLATTWEMYVTSGSGSSGKCGGGGNGGREELPRHQGTLATTTAIAMATRTSKSDEIMHSRISHTLLRACFSLAYLSYPARANVSCISIHNLANRLPEKQKKNASTRRLTDLLVGPIFLLFLRPPESVKESHSEHMRTLFYRSSLWQRGQLSFL